MAILTRSFYKSWGVVTYRLPLHLSSHQPRWSIWLPMESGTFSSKKSSIRSGYTIFKELKCKKSAYIWKLLSTFLVKNSYLVLQIMWSFHICIWWKPSLQVSKSYHFKGLLSFWTISTRTQHFRKWLFLSWGERVGGTYSVGSDTKSYFYMNFLKLWTRNLGTKSKMQSILAWELFKNI
jgi:hypothetical protein